MFTEYALIDIEDICHEKSISVLNKLPEVNGPQLVTSLIKPLVNNLILNKSSSSSLNANNNNKNGDNLLLNCLQDDKDINWIMEVICYGLSLPLADNEQYEAVRDCVNIYCEWLHSLSPNLSSDKCIPFPIRNDPNIYCQKIIGHLYNAFLPRQWNNQSTNQDSINDLISKQALICHRILRLLITIATERDNVISAKTWEHLLIFLLGINQKLLKSPIDINDIGTQIADRVISTLFQGWLISCIYFFPSPSYWRTLQNVCMNSRHCPALISQWNRVNICLTKRLITLLYNHESTLPIDNKINFQQYTTIIMLLEKNVLEQCWYRFIHIIGNPIDLCFPKFILDKIDQENNCNMNNLINALPFIFHKAIKGLCTLVDLFLGIPDINLADIEYEMLKSPSIMITSSNHNANNSNNAMQQQQQQQTPPERRKPNFSVLKSEKYSANNNINSNSNNNINQRNIQSRSVNQPNQQLPTITLPSSLLPGNFRQNHLKLTSILDIFGKWLFPASFLTVSNQYGDLLEKTLSNYYDNQQSSQTPNYQSDIEISKDLFEAGQAEAIGALCRIFSLKKDDEDISLILSKQSHPDFTKLKNYLTSFYLALKFNLRYLEKNPYHNQCNQDQISTSILINSIYLFDIDLPGSKILMPHYFRCIETYIVRKDKSDSIIHILIRRACIKILISLIPYSMHYGNLPIKDDLSDQKCQTFISFYPRLILLFINALYNEMDQINVQMILNSFLFLIEDCFNYKHSNDNNTNVYVQQQQQNEIIMDYGDTLVENLMEFFNKSNCFHLRNEQQAKKLSINLFLLITSFVSDILCKSSLKNSNYNISLTALEILMALGTKKLSSSTLTTTNLCNNKCIVCIQQICCFIENQCCKPSMFHSKDMHSTIVAAYQCLSIWITEHKHLINDRLCIRLLFELIELGISGSKSIKETNQQQQQTNQQIKSEKLIKPTSLRVREAAELFLATLMSNLEINNYYNINNNLISCDINESKIIEHLFNIRSSSTSSSSSINEYSFNQFRYFIIENSILISILDKQINYGETICIIRSSYGKYCFILKNQTLSKRVQQNIDHYDRLTNEIIMKKNLNKQKQQEFNQNHIMKNLCYNYFPDYYDKLMHQIKFGNNALLNLNQYIIEDKENNLKNDYYTMLSLLENVEQNLSNEKSKLMNNISSFKNENSFNINELTSSTITKNFDSYRQIISQFESFNFDFNKSLLTDTNNTNSNNVNSSINDQISKLSTRSLLTLNNHSDSFIEQLMKLDQLSNRINDMVLIFYIPKNFTNESDVFQANQQQSLTNPLFKYFLQSLGNEICTNSANNLCQNIYYWNDVLHELIFVAPSTKQNQQQQQISLKTFIMETNDNIRKLFLQEQQQQQQQQPTTNNNSNLESKNSNNNNNERIKEFLFMNQGCDIKVFVLWIENMDDFDRLPFNNKNLQSTIDGTQPQQQNLIFIITINPLKNGLFRVLNFMPNSGNNNKDSKFIINYPIIDRMLLSKSLLSSYVRLVTLNLFRRRRMNTESFQFPHVKRRLKIQELANKFKISEMQQKLPSEIFKSKFA